MKLLLPILAISVPFATAQTACASLASAIPSCGIQCIYSAGSSVGCAMTNYSCLCVSAIQASSVLSAAENCVIGACGDTALQVLTSAQAVCSCATTNAKSAATSVPASTTSSSSIITSGILTPTPTSVSRTTLIPAVSRVSDTSDSSSSTTSTGLTQIPPFSGVSSGSVSSTAVLSTPMATSSSVSVSVSSSASTVSANGQGVVRPMGGFWAVLGGLLAFL